MSHDHYLFGRFESTEAPLDAGDIGRICALAREKQRSLERLPLSRLLDVLDAAARRWRDPQYEGRRKALEVMPGIVGFHPSMVERAIDALCDVLSRPSMEKKIRFDLGHRDVLDGWRYVSAYGGYLRAQAVGLVLHVSAGNVFVSGVDSLAHGLVTRNASLLKISRVDPVFPLLFARSLTEVDETGAVAEAFAVLSFRGGETEVEQALKREVDGIAVWGGESAVRAWSADLPLRVRLLGYGPKVSFSVLTSAALASSDLAAVCDAMALDVALWEQRACSSPQTVFVESNDGGGQFRELLAGLAKAFERVARVLPPGELGFDEKVEILRHRELARMGQVFGESLLLASEASSDYTIIVREDGRLETSSGNRVLFVKPFRDLGEVLGQVEAHRGLVQSAGLLAAPGEALDIASALVRVGVDRITDLGKMGQGRIGSPHDGTFQLQGLVRWVCLESESLGAHDAHAFDAGRRIAPPPSDPGRGLFSKAPTKWSRLRELLAHARQHAPFYSKRLEGRTFEAYASFEEVPFLERDDVYHNTPPQGEGLLTGPLEHAYVFASGGSTGEPKFTYYTYDEFNEVTTLLAEIYQVAGLSRSDTVGNLFFAGSLWTSFMAANEALEKVGCVTLPIAGNADLELTLRYLQLFKPTALLGLPSVIIQLAELVKARGADVKIRTVLYGGEHVGAEARAFLHEVLGCEAVVSAGYASVDAGPVGYQCSHSEGTVHHLLYDYQFLEIIDPETLEVLPRGSVGEIVITNLNRRLMPMIRYRTGDQGRRVEGTCPCGRPGARFELLGRCDDVVRVGAVSIYPESVGPALAAFPEVSHIYQIAAERVGVKDRLIIRTELARDEAVDCAALAERLSGAVLDGFEELALAVREGWLAALVVEVLPPGGIPRVPRTGKVRKVVDLRG